MTDPDALVIDLDREMDAIDSVVEHLDNDQWTLPAPTPGWTVAHRVAHLTAAVRVASVAATDPEAFAALTGRAGPGFVGYVRASASGYVLEPAGALLPRWRNERAAASKILAALPGAQPVPWRSGRVFPHELLRALMTMVFSHGQDIADALGAALPRTDRLRHVVAHLVAVRPSVGDEAPVRLRLSGPSGTIWTYGTTGAPNVLSGRMEDFCLAATSRRHPDDVDLTMTGTYARTWLESMAREAGELRRTTGAVSI